MNFIGIAGLSGSGKSRLAGFMAASFANGGYSVKVDSLAAPIKAICRNANWSGGNKPPGWRAIMQDISSRFIAADRAALAKRLLVRNREDRRTDFLIIPDVRRPEEAQMIAQRGVLLFLEGSHCQVDADLAGHESESHAPALREMAWLVIGDRDEPQDFEPLADTLTRCLTGHFFKRTK